MKKETFEELVASVREGGAILRGQVAPSRQFEIGETVIRNIREGYQLSQAQFAALLGISVATLQNWEQGRRAPKGAARVLLQVATKHPEAVWDVVNPIAQRGAPKARAATSMTAGARRGKKLRS